MTVDRVEPPTALAIRMEQELHRAGRRSLGRVAGASDHRRRRTTDLTITGRWLPDAGPLDATREGLGDLRERHDRARADCEAKLSRGASEPR